MLPSFCRDTVTRIRPATKESRGSIIFDWSEANVSKADITGCSVQPASTSLTEDGRVLGISELLTLFAPADADIKTGDRIRWNKQDYTINGEVIIQPSASGTLNHINVTLKRYAG